MRLVAAYHQEHRICTPEHRTSRIEAGVLLPRESRQHVPHCLLRSKACLDQLPPPRQVHRRGSRRAVAASRSKWAPAETTVSAAKEAQGMDMLFHEEGLVQEGLPDDISCMCSEAEAAPTSPNWFQKVYKE